MTELLTEEAVFAHIPPKAEDLNKTTAGRLYIVAGSRMFCGAAIMAASGALRCGAGYVTLASTGTVCRAALRHLITPTYASLDETPVGRIDAACAGTILESAGSYDAMLVGCGLGWDGNTLRLVESLLRGWGKTLVLDADGINALSQRISLLREAVGPVVLTPHEGEMARLMATDAGRVHADRSGAARAFARESGAVVVLKGPHTLIAAPDGRMAENVTGNSGLAKAGSGDILAGMIAALAAQGVEPFWAAACGVWLHGAAADRTAARLSRYAMQPTDLLDDLPEVFLRGGR